jgi:hypothetical protein
VSFVNDTTARAVAVRGAAVAVAVAVAVTAAAADDGATARTLRTPCPGTR